MSDTDPNNDFWTQVREQEIVEVDTYAEGNLSGITPANSKSRLLPEGHLRNLQKTTGLDVFGSQTDWERSGFSEQSAIDFATNTFFGTITNIAGGLVEGVAANDMKGAFDMSFGNTEANYGNTLHNWAKGIMETSEKNFHIYDGGDNSPFTKEYWGKQLQSLGYSSGIILEMFGEQALLAALTKGRGNAATAGRVSTQLRKAGKALSKPSVFGSYQGVKEAYLNGLQTGEETFKKYKDAGFSEEQAKEKANEAATLGFRMEVVPLMTMNALQFAALQKYNPFSKGGPNTGYSGAFETLADSTFKNVRNKYAKKALDYGVQAVGEGIEEGIQTGLGKEAQYQTMLADSLVGEQDFFNRTFEGHEMRDSMLGGALGGVMFRFMGKRFNKLTQGTGAATYQDQHDKFLKDVAMRVNKDTADLKEAFDSGDQDKVDVVRKRLQRNNVMEALQLDLINQKETAFDSYISTLENTLDKVNSHSPEDMQALKDMGIEVVGDIEHIRENYPTYIEDAVDIKDKLIHNLQNNTDVNVAIQLTNYQKTIDEFIEFENRSKENIETFKLDSTTYNNLSAEGKRAFNLQNEKFALISKGNSGRMTAGQKARLEEVSSQLSEIEVSESDKNLMIGISGTSNVIQEHLNVLEFQDYQERLSEKIQYWKDPVNQKKEKEQLAKKMIEKAESVAALEKSEELLANEDALTEEVQEKIEAKKEVAEIKEATITSEEQALAALMAQQSEAPPEIWNEVDEEQASHYNEIEEMNDDISGKPNNEMFEPADINDLSSPKLKRIADIVKRTYDNLTNKTGTPPTFRQYVEDYMKYKGEEAADKLYNVLAEGWKMNNLPDTDFDSVYNDIFRSHKNLQDELTLLGEDITGPLNSTELVESNVRTLEKVAEKTSPVVELDVNNNPKTTDNNVDTTRLATLKAAYVSVLYDRKVTKNEDGKVVVTKKDASDTILRSDFIKSDKLLNPDLFNPGTKLILQTPNNFREMTVSTWEDDATRGPNMTFDQWARKNNIVKESREWNNKVPILAYELKADGSTGDPVFAVHSTDWYNLENVQPKDNQEAQIEVITKARENLESLRDETITTNQLTVQITQKRLGTWKQIEEDQPPISLNEANPQTNLVLATRTGFLLNGTNEHFETKGRRLINRDSFVFKEGHIYDVRRSTMKNDYLAFEVLLPNLTESAVNTAAEIVDLYLFQTDVTNNYKNREKLRDLNKEILDITGLQVGGTYNSDETNQTFTDDDFEKLLFSIARVRVGRGLKDIKDLPAYLKKTYIDAEGNTVSYIKEGEPFIIKVGKALAIGVKGQMMTKNSEFLYVNPYGVGSGKTPSFVVENFRKVLKEQVLPGMRQNVNKSSLASNFPMVSIEGSKATPGKNYREYLKDTLQTSVKSFNVGTQQNPVYATIIQPTINFEKANQQITVEDVANKVAEGIPTTRKEDAILVEQREAVDNQIQQAQDSSIDEKRQVLREALKEMQSFGIPNEDPDMQALIAELGETELDEPALETDISYDNIKSEVVAIPGLSIIQDYQVTDYIFNNISRRVDFTYKSSVNKEQLLADIKQSYFDLIEPKRVKNIELLERMKNLPNKSARLESLIARIESESSVYNLIKDNWNEIEKSALSKIRKYFPGIKEVNNESVDQNDTVEVEKNHSKLSLEENGKSTASYRLKRFFAGIKNVKPDGTLKTGFLDVPTYIGFDTVYSTIEHIISSPFEVDSNFDMMITRLEENIDSYKWLIQVIEELKSSEQRIKNEFVYNFARHTLSMKFVMFSKNRDESYTLKVYDTNAGEIGRVIRRNWESNFKKGELSSVNKTTGLYEINKARATYLLEKYNGWVKNHLNQAATSRTKNVGVSIPNIELLEWLQDFGINLSNDALNELRHKKTTYITNTGKHSVKFNEMFTKSASTPGIFGLLADYLTNIIEKDDTAFEENPQNHPFDNASGVLKTLAKIESKYALYATTNSFRDNGKSIYGFTPSKYITDSVKKLKFSQEYRDKLGSKSFNRHSYLLELLNKDESFQEKFYLDHLGITSLKELGQKVFGDNSITALSDPDHETVKLGMFQDMEQGEINQELANGFINMRMARMFGPTMSDKSGMIDLLTAVLSVNDKHLSQDLQTIDQRLLEVMYSQMVLPELERITNFHSVVKETNIKGYDLAAQLFLFIPELNNLEYKDERMSEPKRVISLMAANPEEYNKKWFETHIKPQALGVINSMVKQEVDGKVGEWESKDPVGQWHKNGYIDTDDKGNRSLKFLNEKYMSKIPGNVDKKARVAAYDYVINSLLTNANIYMLIAGDVALYSKGSIKGYFKDGNIATPKDKYGNKAYALAMKDVIGINTGKRLALLIAPGNKLANSDDTKNIEDSKYLQLFLNDFKTITTNVTTLVELYYNEDEAKKAKRLVEKYNNANTLRSKKILAKYIADLYPQISDYFDIEATDAQEYTTTKEHINVLWKQGRLSDTEFDIISKKIEAQLEAEKNSKELPESSMLNFNELKIVLQPIKPVHTGFKDEANYDVMRMMYIKSSSFPLVPQVTRGTELDKLRRIMEQYEEERGKFVRASYESANKVGANTNAINAFNPDGTFNNSLTLKDLDLGALELDRSNFRIQQDVPFKSAKKSEDKVSLGTQTLKLLFGDGVKNIEEKVFKFDDEMLNGKELYKKYADNFENYIATKKQALYDELGLDENSKPKNVRYTMNKLQNLLKREAEERGYPRQDVEALKLSYKKDSAGNVTDVRFNIPLWLSPNSNRYESLLNAIVSNRLVNIKMPGSSYVAGSEAGFKMSSNLTGVNKSRIIFTDKWEGQLKAAEFHSNGRLKKAQILLPSKFRDNDGKLIKLINENGSPNEVYTYRDESGVLRLKEGKIQESLLSRTSFRIPTSGHVSMSQLEIVGILPTEVGDLIIVPSNLTTQKGLDFDIDKETTYHLHTYMDSEGSIKELGVDDSLKDVRDSIKLYKDLKEKLIEEFKIEEDAATKVVIDIQLKDASDSLSNLEEKKQKMLENAFIKVHESVLSSSDKSVQRKINKVLSMDFAKSQAELVQSILSDNFDNTYFSMLSDTYQKEKMYLGASGKLGIGVYSNYVVFHSMVEQSDEPIQLKTKVKDEETNKISIVPAEVQIGNQISNGMLGRQKSLSRTSTRTIAEVFAERQNTATDNEKEQIMGRLNINEVTINADALMSALGFDKETYEISEADYKASPIGTSKKNGKFYRTVSLPYLLLSQPVIKEYVEGIRETKSNLKEYDPAANQKLIFKLREKYATENYVSEKMASMLTGGRLLDNLQIGKTDSAIQLKVLETFLELDNYAKKLSKVQSRLNINKDGLGKSYFETLDKYNAVQSFQSDYDINTDAEGKKRMKGQFGFENITSLIGKYYKKTTMSEETIAGMKEDGFIEFENYMIKPNNPVGSMLVHSVQTGYNLWSDHFPYGDSNVSFVMKQILQNVTTEETSSQKVVEIQQAIFQDMKKYFVTSPLLNTYKGEIQEERKRLFLDGVNGENSLASYLISVLANKNSVLKGNKLISRFEFKVEKNGLPSIIKFDNAKGENFDEEYLYVALNELIEQNVPLPKFNGKEYSTRELAKDLVAYTYLEGGIQEAVQFVKYVPVSLLNHISFGKYAREWNAKYRPDIFKDLLGLKDTTESSRFTKQYVQHNPQRLPKVDSEKHLIDAVYLKKNKLETLTEFALNFDNMNIDETTTLGAAKFISIYNPGIKKGLKKFQVYQKDGPVFKRISTLGVFGMSEYSIREDVVSTITNGNFNPSIKHAPVQSSRSVGANNDTIQIEGQTATQILDEIASIEFVDFSHLGPLAKTLRSFVPNNLKITLTDLLDDKGEKRIANGRYVPGNNEIFIDKTYAKYIDKEKLAKTILHELIHRQTVPYISQFVNSDGTYKVDNVPQEITNLVILFNQTKKKLGKEVDAYVAKRAKQRAGTTDEKTTEREKTVAYAGARIEEFVTLVMTEPDFQKEMMNEQYLESEKSLYERFVSIFYDIISKIYGVDFITNGVTYQGISSVLTVIEKQYVNEGNVPETELQQMEKTDREAEELLARMMQSGEFSTDFGFDDEGISQAETTLNIVNDAQDNSTVETDLESLLEPSDFMYKFHAGKGISFAVKNSFPFSEELINRVEQGKQEITIRQPGQYNYEGIYEVAGKKLLVTKISNSPININFLLKKGKSKSEIEQAFKGVSSQSLTEKSVREWFKGNNKKNVFFIKDITESLDEPFENGIFEDPFICK